MNWKYASFLFWLILLETNAKAIKGKKSEVSLKSTKPKDEKHSHDVHKTDKKTSRSKVSEATLQELIRDPQKLDSDEMQQVKMLDFYNSKFMNSELASESQMLINQGIDADSARKIASMDDVPGISRSHRFSNGMEKGVSKDTFSSRLGMDISRWPEYHIRDSGGYRIATTTDNKPSPQFISSSITDDERQIDEGNNPNMGMNEGQPDSEMSMQQEDFKGQPEQDGMMENGHAQSMLANMYDNAKGESRPSMYDVNKQMGHAQMSHAQMSHAQMAHAQMGSMYGAGKQMGHALMSGGARHMGGRMKTGYVGQGHVRSRTHRHHQ